MSAQEIYILTKEGLDKLLNEQINACSDAAGDYKNKILETLQVDFPPPVVVPSSDEIVGNCYAEYSSNIGQMAYEEGANFILQKLGLKK